MNPLTVNPVIVLQDAQTTRTTRAPPPAAGTAPCTPRGPRGTPWSASSGSRHIRESVSSWLGDQETARWLVRVIVSLLIVPGRDDADERAMVERFVVPSVVGLGG